MVDEELERFRSDWKKEVTAKSGPSKSTHKVTATHQDAATHTAGTNESNALGDDDDDGGDDESDYAAATLQFPEAEIYGPAALRYSKGAHKMPSQSSVSNGRPQTDALPSPLYNSEYYLKAPNGASSSSSVAVEPTTSRFREEVRSSALPFSSSTESGRPHSRKVSTQSTGTQPTSAQGSQMVKSAVEAYARAVEMERSGHLDQALASYRRAFKLNTHADQLYHRAHQLLTDPALATSDPKAKHSSSDAVLASPAVADKIRRALDFDDYRYVAMQQRQAQTNDVTTAKPFPRPRHQHDELSHLLDRMSIDKGGERDFDSVHLEPEDEEKDLPLARLPDEILLHVLRMVVLPRGTRGARIVKPKPPTEGGEPPPPATENGSVVEPLVGRKKSPLGIGIVLGGCDWQTLEIAGRTCWKLRLLTRSPALWKLIVKETYFPPILDTTVQPLEPLYQRHDLDWRTVFVNQPRVRLNGCYIAACHYARPGMSEESAWIRVVHVVEFYRSIRFLPDGRALSLLTTDTPADTVRKLEPSLSRTRTKGFATGKWEVFPEGLSDDLAEGRPLGPKIVIEDLRDAHMQKYAFRMIFALKSTQRGKWNKLDLLEYHSVNLSNGEVLPLPQKHSRPFYFSRVLAYGI